MTRRILEPGLTTVVDYVRAVDGDTIEFKIERTFKVRVRDIDAIELKSQGGYLARDFVDQELKKAKEIIIFVPSNDPHKLMDINSFERIVADVYVDGFNLAEMLRTAGYEKLIQ